MPSAKVLLELLANPRELAAVVQLKLKVRGIDKKNSQKRRGEHWEFCFGILKDVSRSFNIVIQQLGDQMRDAICIFYLVLRGLDTVEDDMALDVKIKRARLKSFWKDLENDDFSMQCGDKEVYRTLMAQFPHVIKAYKELDLKYRVVIGDITKRMGDGMLEFLDKGSMSTIKEYELYCHYVAGLVGIGLSNLFSQSGLESPEVGQRADLSNSMGLFLQKTNIIRDFREDLDDNRRWWPEQIWKVYTPDLKTFISKRPADREQAVQCLNHMVANALEHVPQCIDYLSSIQDHQNFLFCAIPQVMAAHTLALVFNNEDVFQDTLKIRKGRTARLFMETCDLASVLDVFLDAIDIMETKVRAPRLCFTHFPFRGYVPARNVLLQMKYSSATPAMFQLAAPAIARAKHTCLAELTKIRGAAAVKKTSDMPSSVVSTVAENSVLPLIITLMCFTCISDIPYVLGLPFSGAKEAASAEQQFLSLWTGFFYILSVCLLRVHERLLRYGRRVRVHALPWLTSGAGCRSLFTFSSWRTLCKQAPLHRIPISPAPSKAQNVVAAPGQTFNRFSEPPPSLPLVAC